MMLQHRIYDTKTHTYLGGTYRESTKFMFNLIKGALDKDTVNVLELRTFHTMRGDPELVASRRLMYTDDKRVIFACDEIEKLRGGTNA